MPSRPLAPRRRRRPRARSAAQEVVDETIALYQWLAWVADNLYGDQARGASRRWAIRRVHRDGAATVAALARVRAVRRQSLQPIVDALLDEGLVTLATNPRNARSPLVQLTRRGTTLVETLDRIDAAVLRAVARGIDPRDLVVTARTLAALRGAFETRPRWQAAASHAVSRA